MNQTYTHKIQPWDNYRELARQYQTTVDNILEMNRGINPYQLRVGQTITIPVSENSGIMRGSDHCISQAEVDYRNDMRSLWEEHVAWTRMAIISLVFDLPDINEVLARLLKNATDMGNMIRRLYGDRVAATYAKLINEHLLIAAELVKAVIAKDEEEARLAEQKWFANADEIARFLSSINSFLPENAVREMFYKHLELTKQEAISMINKDFKKDIEVYDQIEKQARQMADAISDAMVKQYPATF